MFTTQQKIEWMARGLLKNVELAVKNIPSEVDQLCPNRIDTKQAYEDISTSYSFGFAQEIKEGKKIIYDNLGPVGTKRYSPLIYILGFKVSVQAINQDQFDVVRRPAAALARSHVARQNLECAKVYNNAFSGSGVTLYDGKTMIATDHPLMAGTASNRGDTNNIDRSLDAVALRETLNLMGLQKDHRGIPMPVMGDFELVTTMNLLGQSGTVVGSDLMPGTANNDINWARRKISRVVNSAYIGFGDSTLNNTWFVRAATKSEHSIFFMPRTSLTPRNMPDGETLSEKFALWQEYMAGAIDWRGIRGHKP